jgi:amino acid adenylation domain-containing protein
MSHLIHQLVEAQARTRPEAPAVIDGKRTISYGELDTRSNQLARILLERGVRRGDRVAFYLDKSLESVLAIYGILKAGAAYVPLDPQAPPVRLAYIAQNAGVRVLITGIEKAPAWEEMRAGVPSLETLIVLGGVPEAPLDGLQTLTMADVERAEAAPPPVRVIDDDLAYILYTSGSTGTPKGVMLTHRNCLAFIAWAAREFAITPEDRLSSHAPLHFDLSTFDLYAAAWAGVPVVLVPAGASVFPSQVRRFIEEAGITVWYSVPSILTMLVLRGGLHVGDLPGLRVILFAGEVFPTVHLRRLRSLVPHARFANLYGPTETNVCTWWEVHALSEDSDETIPIGFPIDNVETFVLTEDGRRAGPGEVGELHVRGATVMQGYLGDPEKTASRLITAPASDVLAQPAYRTGDLVQEDATGAYRFLGRSDDQIKSRGYRIELGDVESALSAHPDIVECAVIAVPDDIVTNRLKAFVTARSALSGPELTSFCAERIPQYMIPEHFEFAEALPRTSTGKLDRRALREIA